MTLDLKHCVVRAAMRVQGTVRTILQALSVHNSSKCVGLQAMLGVWWSVSCWFRQCLLVDWCMFSPLVSSSWASLLGKERGKEVLPLVEMAGNLSQQVWLQCPNCDVHSVIQHERFGSIEQTKPCTLEKDDLLLVGGQRGWWVGWVRGG